MKNSMSAQDVIKQYVETCNILRETALSGNYRRGNREGKKIVRVFKQLETDVELAKQALPQLFYEENVIVRVKSAAHCIVLNIFVDQAEKLLKEIADDENSYGMSAFEAKMTLKVWREQGYLKVYPEQEIVQSRES